MHWPRLARHRDRSSSLCAWRSSLRATHITVEAAQQIVLTLAMNPLVPAFTLRPARPQDELCVSVLATQVFLDTYATDGIRPEIAREVLASYSRQAFIEALADPGTKIVVAEHKGHMIGFAQVTLGRTHQLAP